MKNQVTVVPSDHLIVVDGEALVFDYTSPDNIHAIQWYSPKGHIEYIDGTLSFEINYYEDVARYITLWEEEKIRLENSLKPEPEPEVPEPTLEELKKNKETEVNSIRDEKEQEYFIYDGSKFDSNRDAAQRIALADSSARNARDVGKTWEAEWTLYDNTKRIVNEHDLPLMVDSFSYWSGYCHAHASLLKESINNTITKEQLDAIDIVNNWPTPEYVASVYEDVPLSVKAERVSLTKREFLKLIIALTEQTTGMTPITLEMIESYVDTASSDVRLEWEYATFIERSHPMLDVAAESFGISPELLDVMYANSYVLLKKLDAGEPISS